MLKTENDSLRKMPRREVRERIMGHHPAMSESAAHRLAGIWKRAAQRRDIGFYEALRVSGVFSDPTPLEAVKNVERTAA